MKGAGALNTRVVFERRISTDDGFGNVLSSWEFQFRLWASIKALRGGEEVMQGRLAGRQPYILTVRRSSLSLAITPSWRALVGSAAVIHAIRAVADPDGRRRWLDILTEQGVTEG